MRYEIDEVRGFAADPVADQPPGADAHELMVTYRLRLMSLGTEVGTDVADVRGIVVEAAPSFGVITALFVVGGEVVDLGAGAEECLAEEQLATPRTQTSATTRPALEPEIKSVFSRSEFGATRVMDSDHAARRSPPRWLVPP
jgi:hypothetical protein